MAIFPFNKFPNTEKILYVSASGDFKIALGYDAQESSNANAANIVSIGIRWHISRNDVKSSRQPPLGYPNRGHTPCWFIMPDCLAICLLNYIKSKSSSANCTINIPEIDKTLQTLNQQIVQQNSTQGAKNSSLQKKYAKFKTKEQKC